MYDITVADAILLGTIQGFTEWLPISSSGHLVIAQALLGISVPAAYDIVIMIGTIAALILYFRQRLISLFCGIIRRESASLRYCLFIVIAGIGTAVIGFYGKSYFKGLYEQPFIVACLLIVTGCFLWIASRAEPDSAGLTEKKSLLIGIAQGIAVAPGVSRSGSTIGTALLLGLTAEEAALFSFIIGIPAMVIASVITLLEEPAANLALLPLVVGIITSFIAGYASIGILMRLLRENHLNYFAWYCIGAGGLFTLLLYHP